MKIPTLYPLQLQETLSTQMNIYRIVNVVEEKENAEVEAAAETDIDMETDEDAEMDTDRDAMTDLEVQTQAEIQADAEELIKESAPERTGTQIETLCKLKILIDYSIDSMVKVSQKITNNSVLNFT